ncbi:MAG: CHAT domain-containing protein [Bacteroidota bacterium]
MSPVQNLLLELVANYYIEEAILALRAIAKNTPAIAHRDSEYVQLQGRFRRLERRKTKGTLSEANIELEENKISEAVNAYIRSLPSKAVLPDDYQLPYIEGVTDPDLSTSSTTASTSDKDVRILMLMANPRETVKLNLEREHARIHEQLSSNKDYYLLPKYDVRITELNQEIIREKPHVLHFSGHGRSSKPTEANPNDPFSEPQPGEKGGLLLVNAQGDGLFTAPATGLAFMFKSLIEQHEIPLKAVVLNACHSGEQAEAIAQHIDYVIGTTDEVLDEAAWVFSKGFYFSLANQSEREITEKTIKQAFNAGQINAVFMGEPTDRFALYIKGNRVS